MGIFLAGIFHRDFNSDYYLKKLILINLILVVPLSPHHPPAMLEYFLNDSDSKVILTTAEFENIVSPLAEKLKQKYLLLEDHVTMNFKPLGKTSFEENEEVEMLSIDNNISDELYFDSNAMIIYTSGSTGPPKGNF